MALLPALPEVYQKLWQLPGPLWLLEWICSAEEMMLLSTVSEKNGARRRGEGREEKSQPPSCTALALMQTINTQVTPEVTDAPHPSLEKQRERGSDLMGQGLAAN